MDGALPLQRRPGQPHIETSCLAVWKAASSRSVRAAGLCFAHYPATVTEVVAVEPESHLRRLAAKVATTAPVLVRVVEDWISGWARQESHNGPTLLATIEGRSISSAPSALATAAMASSRWSMAPRRHGADGALPRA